MAKLERTSSALKNAWPHIKSFANEQSSNIAQSANETSSTFVRKTSKKAEAGARPAVISAPPGLESSGMRRGRTGLAKIFVPRRSPTLLPPTVRPLGFGLQRSTSTFTPAVEVWPHSGAHPPLTPSSSSVDEGRAPKSKASIEEFAQLAALKDDLNNEFWGKYRDIPSMAMASGKDDVLQIVENFALIHRKHIHLFQRLKNTVIRTLDLWSAPDFAALCHSWAQLGFLHEDLCIAISGRVVETAGTCSAEELLYLLDAYATARCSVPSVTEELTRQTLTKLDDFTLPQLCHHASSFARLNARHSGIFDAIGERLISMPTSEAAAAGVSSTSSAAAWQDELLSARDVTLAAYSFAKLGFHDPRVFHAIARRANEVVRDLTARDLQMLAVALAKARHRDEELLDSLSSQAQRRIAQFNSESLALMLRSLAFFGMRDDPLFTRAVAQLPRAMSSNFRPADITTVLNSFAAVQVYSIALFDAITPCIMEKASAFTPVDWLSALRGYSALGRRDMRFLSVLGAHLQESKLSLPQLCMAMADCSRLSFAGPSHRLADAAMVKLDAASCPAELAASMYGSLLLLGHSTSSHGSNSAQTMLEVLAVRLGRMSLHELPLLPCLNLCHAALLAPALGRGGAHPMDLLGLVEHCAGSSGLQQLPAEGQALLQQIRQALRLLPWNRRALRSERCISEVLQQSAPPQSDDASLTPYTAAALRQLAPCLSSAAWSGPAFWTEPRRDGGGKAEGDADDAATGTPMDAQSMHSDDFVAEARWTQGIFAAEELREALGELAGSLASCGVAHDVVAELDCEVHILINRTSLAAHCADGRPPARDVALLWGSSVHYVSLDDAAADLRLTPAAQLQIAQLRSASDVDVVVVPHWWWPAHASRDEKAGALLRLLTDKSE